MQLNSFSRAQLVFNVEFVIYCFCRVVQNSEYEYTNIFFYIVIQKQPVIYCTRVML